MNRRNAAILLTFVDSPKHGGVVLNSIPSCQRLVVSIRVVMVDNWMGPWSQDASQVVLGVFRKNGGGFMITVNDFG